MYMLQGLLLNNAYLFNSRDHKEELDLFQNVALQCKSDLGIVLVRNKQSRSCYLSNKGELGSLWEMQDVEDSKQTNEGNN